MVVFGFPNFLFVAVLWLALTSYLAAFWKSSNDSNMHEPVAVPAASPKLPNFYTLPAPLSLKSRFFIDLCNPSSGLSGAVIRGWGPSSTSWVVCS